jgi:2-(1,2-epoxy-1,2-dihydrophenyl)acetyl-CoA isomerase
MDYTTLLFDVRDHIARITLNRPEAANALNEDMGRDLIQAILHCDEDPSIRAVVLSAKGSIFCGGGDLRSF